MKTGKLLLTMALPMAFAACTNENLIESSTVSPTEGNLVELGDNFVLTVKKATDAASRGMWGSGEENKLKWSWVPKATNGTGNSSLGSSSSISVIADEIGLCWTGELADGTGSISDKVYTNYQFTHNGWLATGAESAEFDECNSDELLNGKFYNGIDKGEISNVSNKEAIAAQITDDANKVDGKALDLNTGVFSTCNKAIFGGSYIAYYPYNPDFKDAASIPAISPVEFSDVVAGEIAADQVSDNTFILGYAKNLIGGTEASNFSMKPLSAVMSLQISAPYSKDKDQEASDVTLKKIALWSEDGFISSVSLDASKIKSLGATAGEELYVADSKKTSTTLVSTFKSNQLTISKDCKNGIATEKIYLPVLPTTTKNLKVILYNSEDKTAIYSLDDVTFKASKGEILKVSTKAADFSDKIKYVFDAETFEAAVEGTYTSPVTVKVVGDITLQNPSDGSFTVKPNVTVEGDDIIVAEGTTLSLDKNSTVKSNIILNGKSCCGTATTGATLQLWGANVEGNVVSEIGEASTPKPGSIIFKANVNTIKATSTITSNGSITVENPGTNKPVVDVYGTVDVNENSTVEVIGGEVNFKDAKVTNNGVITVAKDVKFSVLNAKGETVASAGENFTNNGTFIDEVGAIVGGATQYMINNGDYICKVADNARMTEAYEHKHACNIIDIVYSGTNAYKFNFKGICPHNEDKDVDIIVSGDRVHFAPVEPITIGNLTIKEGETGLTIATTKTTKEGDKVVAATINVNGDINAYGNFKVDKDVINMTAKNLYVHKNTSTTKTWFENRETNTGNTLTVSGTIEVKKDATFEIVSATADKNTARVTCTRLVEGGTFYGKPIVVE